MVRRKSLIIGSILDEDSKYSKETLASFRAYSSSSNVNVKTILNCLLLVAVPFACFLPIMALELEDISAGLSGRNWNQITMILLGSSSCCGVISTRYVVMVPKSCVTKYHHVLAYISFAITTAAILILVETFLVYPIPFSMVVIGNVSNPVLFGTLLWFERNNWAQVKASVWKFGNSLAISVSLFSSHQLISVLYTAQTDPMMQSIVALLLPSIKFLYRYIVSKYLGPEFKSLALTLTVFEIEFFNTLYTSVFMQTATNGMVLFTLMSIDIIENCFFFFRMNYMAKKIQSQVKTAKNDDTGLRQILSQTEMVVLVELVEVATPILCMAFLRALRELPNLKYVEAIAALSDDELNASLWNLSLLAAFELLSLVAFIVSLKYRFDLPTFI